jgi:hypothetical protein
MPQLDGVADHAPAPDTVPAQTVEPKVTAATTAAGAASLLLWVLSAYVFHGTVPAEVQGMVGALVTTAATFTAGWLARHVDRTAH